MIYDILELLLKASISQNSHLWYPHVIPRVISYEPPRTLPFRVFTPTYNIFGSSFTFLQFQSS